MFSGLATLVIAGYMSQRGAHWVGTLSDTGGVPLVGLVDRRRRPPSPALLRHPCGAQAVPPFALAWESLRRASATLPVAAFLLLYAAFTIAVFVQALMGLPFLPW
jgi:hypothetical protein